MDFGVIIIILSLLGLIAFAYRGFSVIMMAPIMALLAATLSGLAIMPSYTELFMGKAVTYIKSFFPIFLLGAIFGKVMEDTGLARSIAKAIITGLGKEPHKAVLSIVIAASLLTYGGVSLSSSSSLFILSQRLFSKKQIIRNAYFRGLLHWGLLRRRWTACLGLLRFRTLFRQPILGRPCIRRL